MHEPRVVLVTGGCGFIGSNLVHHLTTRDPELRIVNVDKLTYAGSLANLEGVDPARHVHVQADICDATAIREVFDSHPIDTVIHLAAESHVDRSIEGAAPFIETNITGTFVLLEAAVRAWAGATGSRRFHHVSTDEVYGDLGPEDPPFTETTPYAPSSPYSASKAASDHLVRAWARTFDLPVTLSNCSNNYGPRQYPEKLIPVVVRCCVEGRPIPVYGQGTNIRDWLFVDDHCAAIDTIVRRGRDGCTYNIGGDNEWTNIDLVRRICELTAELTGREASELLSLVTFVRDRPGHDRRYAIDSAVVSRLGWAPQVAFDDGLRQTIAWYLGD